MTPEACRIYHYLKATGLDLTKGDAAHLFGMTADQVDRVFKELREKLERKADRYYAGFMVGSYGVKK